MKKNPSFRTKKSPSVRTKTHPSFRAAMIGIFALLILSFLTNVPTRAAEIDKNEEKSAKSDTQKSSVQSDALASLRRELAELLPQDEQIGTEEQDAKALTERVGLPHFLQELSVAFEQKKGGVYRFCANLLGFCLLSLLISQLSLSAEIRPYAELGIALCTLMPLLKTMLATVEGTLVGLREVSAFFGRALPLFSAVELAGGGKLLSSVTGAGISLTVLTVEKLCDAVFLPLVRFLFALALFSAIDPSGRNQRLGERVSRLFFVCSGGICALMTGLFSLQTVIAAASDRATLRAARYAAGMIPAVGGMLSSSLSVLAGGLTWLKSAAGGSVIVAAFSAVLPPLAELLLERIALFFACSIFAFFDAKNGEKLLVPFRTALDATVWLYVTSFSLFFFETLVFLKSGIPIAA